MNSVNVGNYYWDRKLNLTFERSYSSRELPKKVHHNKR